MSTKTCFSTTSAKGGIPIHSLLTRTITPDSPFAAFFDFFVHDFLPTFAMTVAWMAVIWLACAVIVISGYLIGAVVVLGVRALVHACVRYVRRRRDVEYAQLVTVDADGAHTKIVNLDRYRQRRQHRRSDGTQTDNTSQRRCDDDPA